MIDVLPCRSLLFNLGGHPTDAVRLGPADDAVTAAQLRGVVKGLTGAGHWSRGAPSC